MAGFGLSPEFAVVASSMADAYGAIVVKGGKFGARVPLMPTKLGGNRKAPAPVVPLLVSVNSHNRRTSFVPLCGPKNSLPNDFRSQLVEVNRWRMRAAR